MLKPATPSSTDTGAYPRRRRALRFSAIALGALTLLGVVVLSAIGWYYAGVVRDDALAPDHSPDAFDLVAGEVSQGRVELLTTSETSGDGWTREGVDGLAWADGWAVLGPIVEVGEDRVVREVLQGTPPASGTPVRLDSWVYGGDPLVAHGIPFETVAIDGELGPLPAWFVAGDSDTWVIAVHGQNAERREALRVLPVIEALGMPALVISYRNDDGVAPDPGGLLRYGETEWPDLEAAVRYALDHGASGVVLVGYSMGAGIVLSFMEHSSLAGEVRAIVLDAPMISFSASVDFQAEDRGLWPVITSVGKQFASWRFDVDWDATDYRDTARALTIPVLIFHTTGDRTTPPAESVAWAADRPANVILVTTEGEGHVRSWNLDSPRYEAAVRDFLTDVLARQGP